MNVKRVAEFSSGMDDGNGYVICKCRKNIHILFSSKYVNCLFHANKIKTSKWSWMKIYISIETETEKGQQLIYLLFQMFQPMTSKCRIRNIKSTNLLFSIWQERGHTSEKHSFYRIYSEKFAKMKNAKTQNSNILRNLCLLFQKQNEFCFISDIEIVIKTRNENYFDGIFM